MTRGRVFESRQNWKQNVKTAALVMALVAILFPGNSYAGKKKKEKQEAVKPAEPVQPKIDISKLVWPAPPNIPRIRYLNYFAGEKLDRTPAAQLPKRKSSWMDRLAGVKNPNDKKHLKPLPFQLLRPYGMAVSSTGELYVADQGVGAIFIFNTETKDSKLIANGRDATFGLVNGLALDDDDRLFVTDGKLHRVLIFSKQHQVTDQIRQGLVDPVGIAIDTENRFVYVVDTQQDQVIVYDADSLKELRRIGTGGKQHQLSTPGDFAAPTGVALDADDNVYVTDTLNNRVEIFDADGNFISQFGKHCDGPGCFAHPKGIAVDRDGHIWVADPMLDLLQVFNREGQLLAFLGGHGELPGQFSSLDGVYIDKDNRVFTSEQYPGRVQMFRYITDAEADELKKEKEAQRLGEAAKERKAIESKSTETAGEPPTTEPKPQ